VNKRAGDGNRLTAFWGRWGRDLVTAVAVALAVWSVTKVQSEGIARRDQTCVLFERQHNAAVDQLKQTYVFLLHPPPQLKALTPIALGQLPTQEAAAHASTPPAYCAPVSVGLPSPFPRIPPRPKGLR
jgi:hypothetical protein